MPIAIPYFMASGIWTAAAGATAQSQNLDVISNNLANSDTPAFKKDTPTFKEYLTTVEREHEVMDIPRGPIKDKDFYPLDGRDQAFVVLDGTHISFRQGNLRVTQNQLDVALDGPGFLEVSTPQGIRYTRQGTLKLADDGRVVTLEGHPVLLAQPSGLSGGSEGSLAPQPGSVINQRADVTSRYLNLKDRGPHFTINKQGEIYSDDTLLGQLSLVEFRDPGKIKKQGAQLFQDFAPNNALVASRTQVHQGVIENSNVNPIEEMTNLIKAHRLFEHDLKALKTYGDMMGKEATEVGKL